MKRKIKIFNSGVIIFCFKNNFILPNEIIEIEIETNNSEFKNLRNYKFLKLNPSDNEIENTRKKMFKRKVSIMKVSVFNKVHFPIFIGKNVFKPYEESYVNVGTCSEEFKQIRSCKALRVGKINNDDYKKRHKLKEGKEINFCYDIVSQHAGEAYYYAIQSLANPIYENLDKKESCFINRPAPGPSGKAINCRFFNSTRINEQGKCPVGPYDIFISHGIGDKNYWTGKHIKDFNFAFCPGPTWANRMRKTGFKGEIFEVGYTKMDPMFNGQYTKQNHGKPCVVWAPTHGYSHKNKGRSSYPQCMTLINQIPNDYFKIMALHPTSKMNSNTKHLPTMQDLVDADVVIADAGSTLYEAWILGKPVIFPDWLCKKDVLNHFKKDTENLEYLIYSKQIGYHAKDIEDLKRLIPIAIEKGMKDEEKEFIENICPEITRGVAGNNAAKAIKEIQSIIKKG